MRRRLLDAVLDVCSAQSGDPPGLDDVVARAAVSKATFYKYFVSLDDAVEEVGRDLVDDMVRSLKAMFDGPEPAFLRMTVSLQLFLIRGMLTPEWAAFASRPDMLAYDNVLAQGITTHLEASRDAGLVEFAAVEAAATVAIGALREAMSHLSRHPRAAGSGYAEEVAGMILRAVGLERGAETAALSEASAFIRVTAPKRLAWWRDP